MSTKNLNQFLSAANEFDASDLHLVAGVPPAFRVNGEIIIADEDALTEDEITAMADSLHFPAAQRGGPRARHVLPAQRTPGNEPALLRRQGGRAP